MTADYNRRYPTYDSKAEYPYNQVTVTRSGHEIHLNDTPDNESIKIAHTKGSFAEINNEGAMSLNVVSKMHTYIADGFSETVDGQKDVKVRGNLNVNIDNDISEQVGFDKFLGIGGNQVISVGGTSTLHVDNNVFESTDGGKTTSISDDLSESIGGSHVTNVAQSKVDIIGEDWSVSSGNDIEIVGSGIVRIKCKQFIIDADSIVLNSSAGPITITAESLTAAINGGATIQGTTVDLNGQVKINGTTQVGD
jgi:hypothetical protein